ncbi:unnamed protein product [Clavelina lepadiformis]|uniref:phosphoinositide 5-phosphatase n=1 Tax=Clavelina lepadiformis TaxID=159417 RepID=A0ABP0GQD2_CLALP
MSLGRHLKVLKIQQPSLGVLLEHRNSRDFLWVEDSYSIILDGQEGNELKTNSSKLGDAYGCLGVITLGRGSEALSSHLILVTGCRSVGRLLDSEIYRITDVAFVSIKEATIDTSGSDFKRLLCSGSFYFVAPNAEGSKNTLDITCSLLSQSKGEKPTQFLWNRNLLTYFMLRGIESKIWFLDIICGGVEIRTIYVGAQQARAGIINRLSCERVGTRYNVRGVDHSGNVANYVESEQIISIGDYYTSFLQTRGSVPLFWEQPGLNVGSHKVKMPFGHEICAEAFDRHVDKLHKTYSNCVLVNLLGSREGEASLSRAYQIHHDQNRYCKLMPLIEFDYHTECRAGKFVNISKLMDKLNPLLDKFGVLCVSESNQAMQSGVLRVNCLDCLDRTNSVQSYVGLQMISKQLESLGYVDNTQLQARFSESLKSAWQVTGDLISRMYAGTGALEGKDKVGKLKDGARSVSRAIQNNFLDQGKQDTMDKLLRVTFPDVELSQISRSLLDRQQYMMSSASISMKMFEKEAEYCEDLPLRVCVGTWNVNGGKMFRSIAYKDKTLKDWLIFDENPVSTKSYYQAVYEYSSSEESDLSLALSDIVTVDYELEGGDWLHGSIGDSEGIFPAAYVQQLLNPHVVDHDFPAQQDGDLELRTNEVVDVTEEKGEWFHGKVLRDGECQEGMFPANFVTKMDEGSEESGSVDIYAIGFEEMVELNAGNIVNASQANQQAWATELQKTLSEKQEYVLVTSEQLVGVCLFLFVKKNLAAHVREVSISMIKTGMGGAAGNKGAVAISLILFNSSLCFVCSHFAAGQTQVQERNNDFGEISSRLGFAKGRALFMHDYVFWCGDFNYRIDMTGDEVKQLVKEENWEKLRENDQLLVQKKMGNVFKGFMEGEVNFAPTYKYDLFSDDYDTSEKCRVPAWTDRILWKRRKWLQDNDQSLVEIDTDPSFVGTLKHYNRAELKTSDHRPVVALIEISIRAVDETKRNNVFSDLWRYHQPSCCPVFVYIEGKPSNEAIFNKFLATFDLGEDRICRSFRSCMLVIYPEPWMAEEALTFDGSMFEGVRIRVSNKNDNESLEADVVSLGGISAKSDDSSSQLDEAELDRLSNGHVTLPSSQSSDNIKSFLVPPPRPRPSSTPPIPNKLDPVEAIAPSSKAPKKAPPRPPAIKRNYPPTGPPQASVCGESPISTFEPQDCSAADELPSQPAVDMTTWDLSSLDPPKIKPRKTLPKRRAPVPPSNPTQPSNNPRPAARTISRAAPPPPFAKAPSKPKPRQPPPLPANPPVHYPMATGNLLDDSYICGISMPPPLMPMQSSSVVTPLMPTSSEKNARPLFSQSVEIGTSLMAPHPAGMAPPLLPSQPNTLAPSQGATVSRPLMPTKPNGLAAPLIPEPAAVKPVSDVFSAPSQQDPWCSGATSQTNNQINKSFTTDFSDFKFQ